MVRQRRTVSTAKSSPAEPIHPEITPDYVAVEVSAADPIKAAADLSALSQKGRPSSQPWLRLKR
jgi:hypothetical protein